jgi:hypothetical protein
VGQRPAPSAAPPVGVAGADPDTARRWLDELAVGEPGSMAGYSRERFPHWSTVSGACDTREEVLRRDGQDVRVDEKCAATSGRWVSPYDGGIWTKASDVDIDHVVPLAEAWRSGAARWTDADRERFANDLTHHQLLAVTDNVNQAKGDQPPDKWKPSVTEFWCTYSINWIEVKHVYALTITTPEKAALSDMLGSC